MLSLCWLAGYFVLWIASRVGSGHSPARRSFFRTAYAAVFVAPPAALAYGVFMERHQLHPRE